VRTGYAFECCQSGCSDKLRAFLYLFQGEYSKAYQQLQQAVKLYPTHLLAHFHFAQLSFQQGRIEFSMLQALLSPNPAFFRHTITLFYVSLFGPLRAFIFDRLELSIHSLFFVQFRECMIEDCNLVASHIWISGTSVLPRPVPEISCPSYANQIFPFLFASL
jgi:hypothetical protein